MGQAPKHKTSTILKTVPRGAEFSGTVMAGYLPLNKARFPCVQLPAYFKISPCGSCYLLFIEDSTSSWEAAVIVQLRFSEVKYI